MRAFVGKWLIFWISLNTFIAPAAAQPLLDLAEALAQARQDEAAITEYERHLFFHGLDESVPAVYEKLAAAYARVGEMEKAMAAQRAAIRFGPPSLQAPRTFRLCRWLIQSNRSAEAEHELMQFLQTGPPAAAQNDAELLLFLLGVQRGNWMLARQTMQNFAPPDSASAAAQKAILSMLARAPAQRSPRTARWLSAVAPGAGQLYAGAPAAGLNALALNGLIGWRVYDQVQDKHYANAWLLAQFLFWRYYNGNLYHARCLTAVYNDQQIRRYQLQLLDLAQPLFAPSRD